MRRIFQGLPVLAAISGSAFGPRAVTILTPPLAVGQASSPVAALAQPPDWKTLFRDDFEQGLTSQWQLGSSEGPSSGWQIEKEGSNTIVSAEEGSWLLLQAHSWGDFRLKVRIKLLQGGLHIHYRYRPAACPTSYFAPVHTWGVQLTWAAPDCTFGPVLSGPAENLAVGAWHDFEMIGVGGDIQVLLDGVQKVSYSDPNPMLWGSVAFQCLQGSHVHIDDVEITGPPSSDAFQWVRTGGPLGGLGYDVRMRPDNPDIMFVTDTWSGVNKSVDGGRTWFPSNDGIASRAGPSGDAIPIFSLTIDPNNPNVMWTGTQNIRGIFKSVDGGKTWVEKDKGVVEHIAIAFRGFTVDPRNSNIVYAAGEIGSWEWAGKSLMYNRADRTKGVVYRTSDGGENWTAIWRGDNLARYVWIDPRNSDVIYVSTGIFDRIGADSDPTRGVAGGVGIVKSTDWGKTWSVLGPANGLMSTYIGSLFMHPRNPDVLLAGAGNFNFGHGSGAYLTTDGGQHWQQTLSGFAPGDAQIEAVEFSLSDPNVAYAASSGAFYRSQDGGWTWRLMSGGPPLWYYGPPGTRTGVPIDLQVDPRNPNRVFLNAYGGGNFLTEDGGATWQVASKGYTGAQLHDIAIDPRDSSRVYTIGRSGPSRSDDRGENWRGLQYGPANFSEWDSVAVDPNNPENVLISDEHQGVLLLSGDGGRNWDLVFRCPKFQVGVETFHGFRALAFAPSNPRVVYAGMARDTGTINQGNPPPSFGIWKSTDGGRTWQEANDSRTADQNVTMFAVDPRSEDIVYAATANGGVFRTDDGGRSWRPMNQGLRLLAVLALAMDRTNPSIMYAGIDNGGVYKTLDGGATWQPSSSGMDPQAAIRDIVIDPTNPQIVYAADLRTGVYRWEDRGKLWVQINNGLRTRSVTALAISSDGGTLYAATEGEGVFRLDLKANSEGAVGTVSAATFMANIPVAPESIASLFGQGLAAAAATADRTPLPTTLSDASVSITDATGVDRWAPLFFVSPGQINCQIPVGAASGTATVRVFRQNRVVARGQVQIDSVAPGLFTANADGKGAPAAVALRVSPDGTQTQLPVYQCGAAPGSCAPVPIELGSDTDQAILVLFGTGIRGGANVTARIGGLEAPVLYAGPQGQYAGLDQVNVRIPRELRGRGEMDLVLAVDGKTANVVKVRVL